MYSLAKYLSPLIMLASLASCGAKVVVSAPERQVTISSVALLPKQYPAAIARERVDYIYSAVSAELRSNGYSLLDDRVIAVNCPGGNGCKDLQGLAKKFNIQGFFELDLKSAARNNFVAGYYNAIAGDLRLLDAQRAEIVRVEHTESERGGLLFNSGQLFQGLISTADNQKEGAFNALADKFAQTIVSKVPAPRSASASAALQEEPLLIRKLDIHRTRSAADELCLDSSPSLMAFAVFNSQRANLREVRPGHYCGAFRIDDLTAARSGAFVEVRSAFGNAVRQKVESPGESICDLRGKVKLISDGKRTELRLQCTKLSPSSQTAGADCGEVVQVCTDRKLLVFKGASVLGPFQRATELRSSSWVDSGKPAKVYQIVAVDQHGDYSVPAYAEPQS